MLPIFVILFFNLAPFETTENQEPQPVINCVEDINPSNSRTELLCYDYGARCWTWFEDTGSSYVFIRQECLADLIRSVVNL